jgi:hypothetical protein
MNKRTVAVDASGRRIGEDQTGAKLANCEVDLLMDMHRGGMGYKLLAQKFEVSASLVRDIVKGKRRNRVIAGWKVVLIERTTSPAS